jgi:hypothetical protein
MQKVVQKRNATLNFFLAPGESICLIRKSVFTVNLSHVLLHFFSQTETKLELINNQIGDKGAQQLADAIRTSTVNQILSLPVSFTFIFSHVDAHTTRSLKKSHRESRGSTSS